jgi:hypothetical protein
VASLLVSVLVLGSKITVLKDLHQVTQRRKELKANLASLVEKLEAEKLVLWLDDVTHDTEQRTDRITAMVSAPGSNMLENALIEKGLAMFAVFESSSVGVKQLAHSATTMFSETKLDEATHLLLGRSAARIRATPQEIVAYMFSYDSRHAASLTDPTMWVRSEVLQHVHAHHTVVFARLKLGAGLSHRTFLASLVAKRAADDPPTYVLVGAPIASHDKITRKDEAGAVRAENWRTFRLTEEAPGVTKLDYVCSLNLGGSIPQAITNKVSVPGQMHGAPPRRLPHTSTPVQPVGFARKRYLLSKTRCASRYWFGVWQCRQRCSCTSSKFCRSQSVTPKTAESSDSC